MADEPSGRRALLRENRPYALLFTATAGSAVGTYLAALALSVDIFDRTGSGRWLAALLIADFLPVVVIGLTLGPLVDRISRRRLMVSADLVRAATFALLPFVDRPGVIVALAAVNGIATGFFRPAVWAGLPNLVREDEREQATSLLSTIEHVAWMIGPVIAGLLLAVSGPGLAYWVNAVTFVVSALLVSRIPAKKLQSAESLSRGHWRDIRDGLGLVVHSRPLLTVLLAWGTAAFATAAINVAEVVFAKDELGAGNVGLGILVGATGVGLVIGSFFAGWALGALGMTKAYGGGLALMGVGFGLAALSPNIAVAAALACIATIGNGCAIVCNQVLVQRGAPDAMRGRSLAVLMSAYYALLGIGMATAGVLTDVAGSRTVWALAGCVYLVAALIAFVMTRRIREDAEAKLIEDGIVPAAGIDRLQSLLAEIDETRRRERARPTRQLPYIPRRREGSR
ncbi:MAG: MFS transporter [Gaiella sp.]